MLYKRLIWLKWRHLYNGALTYSKNIFHFLTFQTFKLPKRAAKNTKNMTSFPCFVHPEKFHPYMLLKLLGIHHIHQIDNGVQCQEQIRMYWQWLNLNWSVQYRMQRLHLILDDIGSPYPYSTWIVFAPAIWFLQSPNLLAMPGTFAFFWQILSPSPGTLPAKWSLCSKPSWPVGSV